MDITTWPVTSGRAGKIVIWTPLSKQRRGQLHRLVRRGSPLLYYSGCAPLRGGGGGVSDKDYN